MAAPQQNAQIKFSSEELRVLQQCNRESFYQRSLPFSSVMGVATYWAVKSGYMKGSPRFGAAPKVTLAVLLGYIMGKVSYQKECAEKLMALPDSKLGQMLRNKRSGNVSDGGPFSLGILNEEQLSKSQSAAVESDSRLSQLDMDFDRPSYSGLNDDFRPRIDDFPIPPPATKDGSSIPPSSYDDLRRQNREDYEMKRTKAYRGVITPEDVPSALRQHDDLSRQRADPEPDLWSQPQPRKPTNVYGDIFEK